MRQLLGLILLVVGVIILGSTLNIWHGLPLQFFINLWPLLLVLWGIALLSSDRVWLIAALVAIVVGLALLAVFRPNTFARLSAPGIYGSDWTNSETRYSFTWPPSASTPAPSASPTPLNMPMWPFFHSSNQSLPGAQ